MPTSQNVVAILKSPQSGKAFREASTDLNGTKFDLQFGRFDEINTNTSTLRSSDVLLIEIDTTRPHELERLHESLKLNFSGRPVIATSESASPQDVRQLMHMGVADFLPQPYSRADLLAALQRAAEIAGTLDADENRGKIISFIKGGGGTGATTLAVQTACSISMAKTRDVKACLLDFDVQFGTVALHLDLDGRIGLHDLLDEPDRLDAALLNGVMTQHDSGLSVLAAPRQMIPLSMLSTDFISRCLQLAQREYDAVFVDLPEVWTEWSCAVLEESDVVFLVTQLSVACVRQARRQLDTLAAEGLGEKDIKIVMNRCDKGVQRSRALKQAEEALGRKVSYFIPSDFNVVNEAQNYGVPLSQIKKRTKIEKQIEAMTFSTFDSWEEGNEKPEKPRFLFGR